MRQGWGDDCVVAMDDKASQGPILGPGELSVPSCWLGSLALGFARFLTANTLSWGSLAVALPWLLGEPTTW